MFPLCIVLVLAISCTKDIVLRYTALYHITVYCIRFNTPASELLQLMLMQEYDMMVEASDDLRRRVHVSDTRYDAA